MRALDQLARWPGGHACAVLRLGSTGADVLARAGDEARRFPLASVTKVLSALAVLVEVRRGTCALDEPAGPPGATLRQLLSHASGLPLEGGRPLAAPGERRIYSNAGIDAAVELAAGRRRTTPAGLLDADVLAPLAMTSTELLGRPSSGALGSVADLARLAAELLAPTLLGDVLAAESRRVQLAGLDGVLPGFGRQTPCDWGLGVEVKGTKHPHWTGSCWPASTFGHFGQAGGFVVVDPAVGLAVVTLGDEDFGPWARATWPSFLDDVHHEADGTRDA